MAAAAARLLGRHRHPGLQRLWVPQTQTQTQTWTRAAQARTVARTMLVLMAVLMAARRHPLLRRRSRRHVHDQSCRRKAKLQRRRRERRRRGRRGRQKRTRQMCLLAAPRLMIQATKAHLAMVTMVRVLVRMRVTRQARLFLPVLQSPCRQSQRPKQLHLPPHASHRPLHSQTTPVRASRQTRLPNRRHPSQGQSQGPAPQRPSTVSLFSCPLLCWCYLLHVLHCELVCFALLCFAFFFPPSFLFVQFLFCCFVPCQLDWPCCCLASKDFIKAVKVNAPLIP